MESAWSSGVRSLIVLGLLYQGSPAASLGDFEYAQVHMGMEVRMRMIAAGRPAAEGGARAAFARIAQLDAILSDYRAESELRRLEHRGRSWTTVSPELFEVVRKAAAMATATDGAFDPTVAPMVRLWREARRTNRLPDASAVEAARARVGWRQIELDPDRRAIRLLPTRSALPVELDLGGIAKGYILQEALRVLRFHGVPRALIEAGGDIVVGDPPPGRTGWQIDVGVASAEFVAKAQALTNAALATSGPSAQFVEIGGLRYSHVVDPRTGLGLTNGLHAQVIAADAATADALATALTVAGPERWHRILGRFPDAIVSMEQR